MSVHDDGLFREKLTGILPGNWELLSKRQQETFVGRFRKAQHVWRFQEAGDFRNKVLDTMPEAKWHSMLQEQQRGFWHMYRYAGGTAETSGQMYNRDFGSVTREPADESVPLEPPRAAQILRSRPRSRQRPAHPLSNAGAGGRRRVKEPGSKVAELRFMPLHRGR